MVGAVAALLALAVGIGAFFVVRDEDDPDDARSPATTTSSTLFEDTTSTTVGATSSTTAAAATSSTTARSTSTTTRASTTTTTGGTTTTTVLTSRCGTGNASVSFAAKDLVTDALSSSFTPLATVENKVDQPIEVKEITVEVTYPNNEVRTVRFSTTGTVVAPGTTASFTSDKLTSAQRYSAVRFTRFTYFTQGQESNCTVTTP